MTYFCTVHKDEDQQALVGALLEPGVDHMVFDSGYDLETMRNVVLNHPWKVIWEMEKNSKAKFGYSFKRLVGIPS